MLPTWHISLATPIGRKGWNMITPLYLDQKLHPIISPAASRFLLWKKRMCLATALLIDDVSSFQFFPSFE